MYSAVFDLSAYNVLYRLFSTEKTYSLVKKGDGESIIP